MLSTFTYLILLKNSYISFILYILYVPGRAGRVQYCTVLTIFSRSVRMIRYCILYCEKLKLYSLYIRRLVSIC